MRRLTREDAGIDADPFQCSTVTPLVLSDPMVISGTVAGGQTVTVQITMTDTDPSGYVSYPGVVLTSSTPGVSFAAAEAGPPGSSIEGAASKPITFRREARRFHSTGDGSADHRARVRMGTPGSGLQRIRAVLFNDDDLSPVRAARRGSRHPRAEMTERYSSVAQVEVEAAVGKVISLAGYRDLLSERPGGCEMGVTPGGRTSGGVPTYKRE